MNVLYVLYSCHREMKQKENRKYLEYRIESLFLFFQANKLLFTVDNVNFIDFFPNFLAFLLQSDAFLLNIKKI